MLLIIVYKERDRKFQIQKIADSCELDNADINKVCLIFER